MLLVDVVVGLAWARGSSGDKMRPLLPGEQFKRYNSLVNVAANPATFVVQHPSQAYPAYLYLI